MRFFDNLGVAYVFGSKWTNSALPLASAHLSKLWGY